ncbi:Hypothetical_protein [Hexamita inflata]|uniref:Hypothetical_protein n=1 Tax=Hexamita inflata TaxID=28002 RepID=A0ABP1HLZ4_9EUKA
MWPNTSFIRDIFNTRQQQHKYCVQYIINTSILLIQPDQIQISDSEPEQLIHFENQLQTNAFKTKLFRDLISSAAHSKTVSARESFSTNENGDEILSSDFELFIFQ